MVTRYGRCATCRDFFVFNRLAKMDCPSCAYTTFRCEGCGGKEGTRRSILCHFSWYRTRGDGIGGHDRPALINALRTARRKVATKGRALDDVVESVMHARKTKP